MICTVCGHREAVVFMSHDAAHANGDLALCTECAAKRGLLAGNPGLAPPFDYLSTATDEATDLQCPNCGSRLELVRKEARIGCAQCAKVFRPEIERYLRARSRPPYYQESPRTRGGPATAAEESRLLYTRLGRALAAEEYEEAARLRDAVRGLASATLEAGSPGLPGLEPKGQVRRIKSFLDGLAQGPGEARVEGDVVLETRAVLQRNLRDLEFSATPPASFLEGLVASVPEATCARLGALGAPSVAALVEVGHLPASAILHPEGLIVLSGASPAYLLLSQASHIEARYRGPGLCPAQGLEAVSRLVEPLGAVEALAFDEDFGFLAPRLKDCGTGLVLEALVHLPALGAEGLVERSLRGILARGYQVRACQGEEYPPAGDLYVVATQRAFGSTAEVQVQEFEVALGALALAERRAREGLLKKDRDRVLDALGRALGLFRYGRLLGQAEAAASISVLRMGALLGLVVGLDTENFALLLGGLGPSLLDYYGSDCQDLPIQPGEGDDDGPGNRRTELSRANWYASVTASAAIDEGDSLCSED